MDGEVGTHQPQDLEARLVESSDLNNVLTSTLSVLEQGHAWVESDL